MAQHPDPKKYPALFKRWLRTGAGKRWLRAQEREKKEREKKWPVKPNRDQYPNRGKRWTEADDEYLREQWGSRSLKQLSQHFERTQQAVSSHARVLGLGPASATEGAMSLHEFSRYSGFSRSKIRRAAEKLGISLAHALNSEAGAPRSSNRRGGTRVRQRIRTYSIKPDQQVRLLEYMMANPIDRS